MATIVTRAAKGSPLTHNEVDANFTNLNTDKAETSALAAVATTGAYSDLTGKPTLGTAAATNATAYATAAQGSLADSALQGNQTITLSGDLSGSGTTSISAQIAANVVNANELNVVGNGTATQFLRSDADGSFTWAVPTDTNTTYTAGTGLALTGTVFSNTITNNNQLTNGAGYITSDTTKLPLAGGAMTGPITTNSTFDGRDVSVDGTKLDGIAAGANNYSFPYTVSAAAGNNTVVQRDGSGYIHGNYFNGTGTFGTNADTSGMGIFTGTNGTDTYGRSYTAAAARTLLNVADGATNVTNTNQLTNGAGYTTYTANQAVDTTSSPTFSRVTANDWFYVNAAKGIYWATYGGGWRMEDTSWMRSYADKGILTGGTMQAATFNTTSDIKLKENVKTITGALDTVCALRGVTFDWIATKESTLGFIAQEVEKVVPELVSHNVEDDIKTVNYGNMVALLTEAVKELKAEIEELKKR